MQVQALFGKVGTKASCGAPSVARVQLEGASSRSNPLCGEDQPAAAADGLSAGR